MLLIIFLQIGHVTQRYKQKLLTDNLYCQMSTMQAIAVFHYFYLVIYCCTKLIA